MGGMFLVVALLSAGGTGEPYSERVLLDVQVTAADPITGAANVLSDPKFDTQLGRPVTLRMGGKRTVTGHNGKPESVQVGLAVEVTPSVRRTAFGPLVNLSTVTTRRMVFPGTPVGFHESSFVSDSTRPFGQPIEIRLAGDGEYPPLTVTVTARGLDQPCR